MTTTIHEQITAIRAQTPPPTPDMENFLDQVEAMLADNMAMAMILRTFSEPANWEKKWSLADSKYHSYFVPGSPRVGRELVEYIASQYGLTSKQNEERLKLASREG